MSTTEILPLTEREMEILLLCTSGLRSAEVADTLFISKRTVDSHLAKVYFKLRVHNRMQAYHKALQLGLLPG